MTDLDNNLAEILGFLCAEGSHIVARSSYWGKERGKLRYWKNKKSERIEVYSKDLVLLKHYQKLLYLVFGYSAKITKDNKINIGNRKIISDLINYTELGHLAWRVPNSIKNGNSNIKFRFLRGYFDGDGTCSNRIRFFSTNHKGLKEVSALLKDLNIKHTSPKPMIKPK